MPNVNLASYAAHYQDSWSSNDINTILELFTDNVIVKVDKVSDFTATNKEDFKNCFINTSIGVYDDFALKVTDIKELLTTDDAITLSINWEAQITYSNIDKISKSITVLGCDVVVLNNDNLIQEYNVRLEDIIALDIGNLILGS